MLATKSRYITFAFVALLAAHTVTPVYAQSVVVFGSLDQAISWLESEDWWGEDKRGNQLDVPHAMLTGIPTRWQQTAKNLPVAQKKEIFYRFMLPLVMLVDFGMTFAVPVAGFLVSGGFVLFTLGSRLPLGG